jgi:uncharacterized protein (DUF736 family)
MAVLSPIPDKGPRFAGSLRSTPALRGFGYRLPSKTVPAVSPTFSRCAPCKPGDPPPPSRPAAAEASARNRLLSRPHTGASLAKGDSHDHRQFHLQRSPGHIHGRAFDLLGRCPQSGVPADRGEDRQGAQLPRHRCKAGDVELGAAWKKRSEEGRYYLSVKLDDPALPQPINCAMVESGDKPDVFILVWSRDSRRAKAE